MRIIAGSARGIPLVSPAGDSIRPTLDRVRESLFNILMPRLPECAFLDLFAGTGANGIEALSRGAASCIFVDNGREALELVRKNLEKTRLTTGTQVFKMDVPRDLKLIQDRFDVIFADPPHAFTEFEGLLAEIGSRGMLNPDGVLVLEHATGAPMPAVSGPLNCVRHKKYGQTTLSFYA
ncbi:MAG: 16S rRNA (guanine(966)-N(2))-methyltransferase RsmD [Candidatus Hydrogenedentes bacterium]|nr:16S rRNA (guanine(966)-N(2))-methyltransferase RsmD [Candidatus Hydrogenedentota bacterium]